MIRNNSQNQGGQLRILNFEGNAAKYINELIRLDRACLSTYSTVWTEDNFMLDLPQKGQLSKLAILEDNLIGYLICSSYQDQRICHIHRLAVRSDYRRLGIAQRLCKTSFRECLKLGISKVTVETANTDIPAKNLYTKLSLRLLGGVELDDYISRRGKEHPGRFSRDRDGFGVYSIELKRY